MSTESNIEPSQKRLSLFWIAYYISTAMIISVLYYLNPGLWRLLKKLFP